MLKEFVALSLVSFTMCQIAEGGDNQHFALAPLPVPHDKCSVAAANDANLRLTAVAWGYDNSFWVSKQTPAVKPSNLWGPFDKWTSLGGTFAGGPTVIRNSFNDLVIFGRGADMRVWYQVLSEGNEDGFTSLGGRLLSTRVTAVLDPQGLIHIFGRGKDSAVWEKRQYANGTEAEWGEWTSLGGIVTSNVAAVVDAEGITHLFARGVDGFMWKMTQKLEEDRSLTWVAWQKSDDSVYLSSSATIVAHLNAQNLIEVVVRGGDKAFWHTRQTSNDERGLIWSPWKSLGGIFASSPSMRINSASLMMVFGRGPEKGLWYKQQAHHPVDSASDAWSKWVPLGGRFSASLDAVPDSRGFITVFGRGLDRSVWARGQLYSNGTVGFFGPWTNLGGRFRSFPC